jgi:hypothetical protein
MNRDTRIAYYKQTLSNVNVVHDSGLYCITGEQKGKFVLLIWQGRKSKPRNAYAFKTCDQRAEYYKKQLESAQQALAKRATLKSINNAFRAQDHFAIGDIIVNKWGYEQTNVDFYKVTGFRARTKMQLTPIAQTVEPGSEYPHGMACNVLPNTEITTGQALEVTVKYRDWKKGAWIVPPASYYYFTKWDGRSEYRSWYA